jgi:L-lactate dehydrogenase complex protein LldG
MSSRDAILHRIRTALANDPPRQRPSIPEVWPATNPTAETMAARFTQELTAIFGEVVRVANLDEARAKLAAMAAENGWKRVGATDRPLCRQLASAFAADQITWSGPQESSRSISELDLGLVEADHLLADTGTSMVASPTPQDRLMTYLPPACVVIGPMDRLVEHLPAAWDDVASRAADPTLRGEFVFITGPSRTADIEKILILGVHGPKRLIVLLIG